MKTLASSTALLSQPSLKTYSIGSLLTSVRTVSHVFDHARGASEEMMKVSADGSSTVHAVSMWTI